MRVEVRLFATLAKYGRGATAGTAVSMNVRAGATLADLLKKLAIPPEEIHLAMIDGRVIQDREIRLREGARIGFFPPVGGG